MRLAPGDGAGGPVADVVGLGDGADGAARAPVCDGDGDRDGVEDTTRSGSAQAVATADTADTVRKWRLVIDPRAARIGWPAWERSGPRTVTIGGRLHRDL